MSDQATGKEFTWNNPAMGTLRACDVAEIRQLLEAGASDAEVSRTLWERAGKYRRIRRTPTDDGNKYDITLIDGASTGQEGSGPPAAPVPPEMVEDIKWLHAGGFRRDRLALHFKLDLESLAEILPSSIEQQGGDPNAAGTMGGGHAGVDADRREIPASIAMTPGIARRVQAIRDWEPPEGVRRDILVEANGRPRYLKVHIRCKSHETTVGVSKHDPIQQIIESLISAAAIIRARANPPRKRGGSTSPVSKASI